MKKMDDPSSFDISISVVSHLQMALVSELLEDLEKNCRDTSFELILTLNQEEYVSLDPACLSYPVKIVRNTLPKGYGANHNQAFKQAAGRFFCVMNPDIRLDTNPFPLLMAFSSDTSVGVVAPLVVSQTGTIENSARRFPTPLTILGKVFGRGWGPDYVMENAPVYPDWVGGMLMLFRREVFERVAGFDERYFLYYEDVDICARLGQQGYRAMICPGARVVHHAQRTSHRDFRYWRWHLKSMALFFISRSRQDRKN